MYKLSIITINLNNAAGLKKTIESVVCQTYMDFEYLIIDGSSTDDSVDVIKYFINQHGNKTSQIHSIDFWISEKDNGVYHAMNKGIKQAKGEYLLFLNSGDYITNADGLAKIFCEKQDADILLARCNITKNGKVVHVSNPPLTITFGTLYFIGINHQSTLIKKELFNKLGYYDENYKYNGDIEFWYRSIILNNATTACIPIILTNYNLEGMSTTNNNTEEFISEHERILSNPLFEKFVPDYYQWKNIKKKLKIFYWLENKIFLFFIIKLVFTFSNYISRKIIKKSS